MSEQDKISRREFTIRSAAVLGAGVGVQQAPGKAQKPGISTPKSARPAPSGTTAAVSAAAATVRLTVNGWKYELRVEPESMLRDLLRDQLGILSVKDMCNGQGACGSCSVIMNGRVVLSCLTLAVECNGAAIETAEGIAAAKPELIEAYVMNHAMQCGYCTPGFVVTAKALLDRTPKPTEEHIREALGGNICRCGTYPQHIVAIKEASGGEL